MQRNGELEPDEEEEVFMPLDRREQLRFLLDHTATVEITENDEIKKVPARLLDVSMHSVRIATANSLPCPADTTLEIADMTPPLLLPAKIEQVRLNAPQPEFLITLGPLQEAAQERLRLLISASSQVPDRRSAQAKLRQKALAHERRLTKPVFLKCLRYNRIDKLMEKRQYFYNRELQTGSMNRVLINGRLLVNFGSNNYLGLSTHPEVKEAAIRALEKYGMGTGGSRVLSGTMDLHNQLEERIARFKGEEACLVFNSGYHANVGIISSLLEKKEYAVIDEKSHASIIDGCFLSDAQMLVFRHNDMADLEKQLKKTGPDDPILIISDGVFSMDGDIVRLPEMAELATRYNAAIMLDDAHALGVLGEKGRGTTDHFGLPGTVDLTMGTLSKATGALGGFVAGKRRLIHFLRHNCRSFIFTTSLPPSISAATLKAFDLIERESQWIRRLWVNIDWLKEHLIASGFDIGPTETAIFPIMIRDESIAYKMTAMLENRGIFVCPVAYPAVRKRESRLRVSLMATHTQEDLEKLVDSLISVSDALHFPRSASPEKR